MREQHDDILLRQPQLARQNGPPNAHRFGREHLAAVQEALDLACTDLALPEDDTAGRDRVRNLIVGAARHGLRDVSLLRRSAVVRFATRSNPNSRSRSLSVRSAVYAFPLSLAAVGSLAATWLQ